MNRKTIENARKVAVANGHSTYTSLRLCPICIQSGQAEFTRYASQGQCVSCSLRRAKIQSKLKAKVRLAAREAEQDQNEIEVLLYRRARYGTNSASFPKADEQHLNYLLRKRKPGSRACRAHNTATKSADAESSVGPVGIDGLPNPWD